MASVALSGHRDEDAFTTGKKYIAEAIKEDNASNYVKAKNLYERGIGYFLHTIKYTKNDKEKDVMTQKVQGYLKRAEAIAQFLKEEEARKVKGGTRGGGKAATGGAGDKSEDERKKGWKAALDVKDMKDEEPFDLELELKKIIGLESVKTQLRTFQKTLLLDQRRRDLGMELGKMKAQHMMFLGNPGTGKTTMARLVSKVLSNLGFLEKGHLVEVQRSDLVAGYVGHTGPKTQAVVEEARGGVLFVDEAYRLVTTGGENDFGREALDTLMRYMNEGDPIMIFAGYENEMKEFLASNPGLPRRIQQVFDFPDYKSEDIAAIFLIVVRAKHFRLPEGTGAQEVAAILNEHTTPLQRSRMNGGLCKILLQNAKQHLDRRLTLDSNLEELMTLTVEDLVAGCAQLPPCIDSSSSEEGGSA